MTDGFSVREVIVIGLMITTKKKNANPTNNSDSYELFVMKPVNFNWIYVRSEMWIQPSLEIVGSINQDIGWQNQLFKKTFYRSHFFLLNSNYDFKLVEHMKCVRRWKKKFASKLMLSCPFLYSTLCCNCKQEHSFVYENWKGIARERYNYTYMYIYHHNILLYIGSCVYNALSFMCADAWQRLEIITTIQQWANIYEFYAGCRDRSLL